ncbi:MAG: hypothetical protein ACK56I_13740, partial [bacterium]
LRFGRDVAPVELRTPGDDLVRRLRLRLPPDLRQRERQHGPLQRESLAARAQRLAALVQHGHVVVAHEDAGLAPGQHHHPSAGPDGRVVELREHLLELGLHHVVHQAGGGIGQAHDGDGAVQRERNARAVRRGKGRGHGSRPGGPWWGGGRVCRRPKAGAQRGATIGIPRPAASTGLRRAGARAP